LVVVGEPGVGKTSLLYSYVKDVFPSQPAWFEEYSIDVVVSGLHINVTLCEATGKEEYDRVQSYTEADGFIVCFSVAEPSSFEMAKTKWIPELLRHRKDASVWLVGTQTDLREEEPGLHKDAMSSREKETDLVAELGATRYLECSALTQSGVRY